MQVLCAARQNCSRFQFLVSQLNKKGHGLLWGLRDHFKVKRLVINWDLPEKVQGQNDRTGFCYYDDHYCKQVKVTMDFLGWIQCEECNYHVKSIAQYKEHIELNHLVSKRFYHCFISILEKDDQSLQCDQCKVEKNSKKELARHVQRVQYQKTYDCDSCSEIFTREDNLCRHIRLVHTSESAKKFICPDCGKNFLRKCDFERHMSTVHVRPVEFLCFECGATFNRKANLERHNKSYVDANGSFNFNCGYCDKVFCTSKLLRTHVNDEHIGLNCEICKQKFSHRSSLEKHIKDRNLSTCSVCDVVCCHLNSLRIHKGSHNYVTCDICLQNYLKDSLKYHKLMEHEHKIS